MSPEEIKLRGQMRVLANWIIEALKVLDTLDPEDTTEAEALSKLIRAGELLAMGGLANASSLVQREAQPATYPICNVHRPWEAPCASAATAAP